MVVISQKPGQLCNRLFVFAHFAANALEHGYAVLDPALDEYADLINGPSRQLLIRFPASPHRPVFYGAFATRVRRLFRKLLYRVANKASRMARARPFCNFSQVQVLEGSRSEPIDLSPEDGRPIPCKAAISFVRGYFYHAKKNLQEHRQALLNYFGPAPPEARIVEQYIEAVREQAETLIGVHVRQGDYADFRGGKYLYSLEAYAAVMRQLATQFPGGPLFVLCTNGVLDPGVLTDIKWQQGPGGVATDLYALSRCDYILGPPSSYSRWAAFYGAVPLLVLEDPDRAVTVDDFRSVYDDPWLIHRRPG